MTIRLNSSYLAAKKCLVCGIPFALCYKPGVDLNTTPEFYVENPSKGQGYKALLKSELEDFDGFVISPFDIENPRQIFGIRNDMTVDELFEFISNDSDYIHSETLNISFESTDESYHKKAVKQIIDNLESDSDKTVLSRTLVKRVNANPIDVAFEYFTKHSSCFRYIFYLPSFGIWFGATPELLLEYNRTEYNLKTMSLAGTRKISVLGEWDSKNTLEHDIVTNHICDVLSELGMTIDVPKMTSIKFGEIEHLCHFIKAHGCVAIADLISNLSPTPAVCGWPRELSYSQIIKTEKHQRLCYGGVVGTTCRNKSHLYVNLRCAHTDIHTEEKPIYTLFAGGGITRYSCPNEEWNETELKLESLLTILEKFNSNKAN